MQPATDERFYESTRSSVFSFILVLATLSAIAVFFADILAVVAVSAILISWIVVYNGTLMLLRLAHGPRAYAVDQVGIWRGRGKRMKLLFEWRTLECWYQRSVGKNDTLLTVCTFHYSGKKHTISPDSVSAPSVAEFEAQVARFAPLPPSARELR